jgi:hypothetical protein
VDDYPFLDLMWTMIVFFLWVMWFWLLIVVWTDIFRRDDWSGVVKALWLIFTIILPFLAVFIYLIAHNDGMTKRNIERAKAERAQFDEYVRETAGAGGASATAEIERAKALLDSGAITQAEFDAIKQKALA